MDKSLKVILGMVIAFMLSACVTQNFGNDKNTPIVENDASDNEMAMTRISLGLGYLKMGNTTQAKLNLEKAKGFAPKLVQVHAAFAHYYDTVGETKLAMASYEQAITIKPDDADTLNNYGVFLCKHNEYDKAEEQILKAIAVPSYILVSQSYENLALCQLQAHDFTKAEAYLNKSIQHSPNNASALLQMVRLHYAKADYKVAQNYLKLYEKATRRFSASALALAYKIFEKQNDKEATRNYGTMLVKIFPGSYEAKQFLLNGLIEIEADVLAQHYQKITTELSINHKKKRTIKLSPKTMNTYNSVVSLSADMNEQSVDKAHVARDVKQSLSTTEAIESKMNVEPQSKVVPKLQSTSIHVVQKGESLFSISKKYNIQMKAIEHWNGIKRSQILKVGDVIYLAEPKLSVKS